jgi:hypothetical protein
MDGLLLPGLLVAQGVMAGIDTVLNHEVIVRLPQRPAARTEIGLHVLRELIWTALFAGLAWFAWHGAAAAAIALLLAAEIVVTACDEFVEHRTRVLPVFLTLNLGVIVALLAPRLLEWGAQPTALVARSYGVLSWLLALLALAAAFWALRDFLAWRRLR